MYSPPDKAWEYITKQDLPVHIIHMSEGGGLPPQDIVVTGVHHDEDGVVFINNSKPGRHWELPTGRVEDDEDIDTAIYRELSEETGRHVEDASPELAVLWVFPTKTMTNIVFEVDLGEQARDIDDEINEVASFTDLPDEISFHDSGRVAYDYIITEIVHDGTDAGYLSRFPVERPSNKLISAIAGLTVSSVVIAGAAHRLFTEDESEPENTEGAGWRGALNHVRKK